MKKWRSDIHYSLHALMVLCWTDVENWHVQRMESGMHRFPHALVCLSAYNYIFLLFRWFYWQHELMWLKLFFHDERLMMLMFSSNTENCRITDVPRSVYIISGHSQYSQVRKGQIVKFRCDNPTTFIHGSSEVECLDNGQWSHPFPTCRGNSILLLWGKIYGLKCKFYVL